MLFDRRFHAPYLDGRTQNIGATGFLGSFRQFALQFQGACGKVRIVRLGEEDIEPAHMVNRAEHLRGLAPYLAASARSETLKLSRAH